MNQTGKTVLLRDKGEFTKFQILLEVMRGQPHVKQKDISYALGITIQAVSKYFKKLTKEGLLEAGSERADYRLTPRAMAKLHEDVKTFEDYVARIKRDLKVERTRPAVATQSIKAGEEAGLVMRAGVLYAVSVTDPSAEAFGVASTNASTGEDVGLKDLRGKVRLKPGKILIVKLPSIKEGGSRVVNLESVRRLYIEFRPDRVGVMGSVGRAVLNKLGLKADLEFGISRAAAIAASRGLNVLVLVVGRMVNRMIEEIDMINLRQNSTIVYEVRDSRTP